VETLKKVVKKSLQRPTRQDVPPRQKDNKDLFEAIAKKDLTRIKSNLENPLLSLSKSEWKSHKSALYLAIQIFKDTPNECLMVVRWLLAHPNCSATDGTGGCGSGYDGFTSSLYCAIESDPELVELLLEHGANPNIGYRASEYKMYSTMITPLYCAITKNLEKVVGLLLQFGADVNTGQKSSGIRMGGDEDESCLNAAKRVGNQNIMVMCEKMVLGWSCEMHCFYSRRARENVMVMVLLLRKIRNIPIELVFSIIAYATKPSITKTTTYPTTDLFLTI